MIETKICRVKNAKGSQCKAPAMTDSDFCFFHNPNKTEERIKASQGGGMKNKAITLPKESEPINIFSSSHVLNLLNETIHQVRTGKLDPKVANCVGYLSGIALKAIEQDKLEDRIVALEMAIKENEKRIDSTGLARGNLLKSYN